MPSGSNPGYLVSKGGEQKYNSIISVENCWSERKHEKHPLFFPIGIRWDQDFMEMNGSVLPHEN